MRQPVEESNVRSGVSEDKSQEHRVLGRGSSGLITPVSAYASNSETTGSNPVTVEGSSLGTIKTDSLLEVTLDPGDGGKGAEAGGNTAEMANIAIAIDTAGMVSTGEDGVAQVQARRIAAEPIRYT